MEAEFALSVQTGAVTLVANVAVTLALMLTVQLPVPLHAPLQPVKMLPVVGVAVRVTFVPLANDALQVEPQLMPAGVLLTVPVPAPVLATVRTKEPKDCPPRTNRTANEPLPPRRLSALPSLKTTRHA